MYAATLLLDRTCWMTSEDWSGSAPQCCNVAEHSVAAHNRG